MPAVSKVRLVKVATPFITATQVELPRADPPGPLAMAMSTVDELEVTTLPTASSTATMIDGLSASPAVPSPASGVTANLLAVAGADGDRRRSWRR